MQNNFDDHRYGSDRAFLHTQQAGAFLPLMQSAITGVLLGLLAFAVLAILRVRDAWLWGLLIGLVSITLVWMLLQRHWFSLTAIEKATGLDLNQDGSIGEPEKPREVVRSVRVDVEEVLPNKHLRITTARLPITEEQLEKLAQGLVKGVPFSERRWTGSSGLFAISEFKALREEMEKRNWIKPKSTKSGKQGWKLTRLGWLTMCELAGPPTLGDDDSEE